MRRWKLKMYKLTVSVPVGLPRLLEAYGSAKEATPVVVEV